MIRRFLPILSAMILTCSAINIAPAQETKTKPAAGKPTLPSPWIETLSWRSIGPANMSGRIPALAVYEKDPNMWWAASASGGLLKTVNNGVTFEHQFDQEATVSIGDVQVAQSDPNIVWVGTGEANPRNSVSWGDGVYKSTDGGKTWKNMGLKKTFQIGRIAIHPTDPNIVYVGAMGRLWGPNEDRGLYKTTDGGEEWKKVLYVDDKTGVIDLQMSPANPDHLILATYERQRDGFDGNDPDKKFGPGAGVYITRDGGETFEKVTKGLPEANLGRIGISIYRQDPKQIYLVLESEKIGQMPEKAGYAGIRGENADVGARITNVVDKSPAKEAGLKVGDIVISVDGETIHAYKELTDAIDKLREGDKVKLGLSRDRKSTDLELVLGKYPEPKQQQQRQRGGSRNTSPQDRARSGSKYAASLGGQRENMIQGPDGHQYGGIYHSEDGGKSWKRINSLNPRPMYYSQIRVDPTDNKNIWVLGTSLYLSKDGGKTFSSENTARGIHVDHHSMWIDPQDGRHVILGNDGGVHVTYDQGAHWDHYNHVAIGQFYHVAVGPRRDYYVYGGLQDNGSWGGPNRGPDGSGPVNTDWLRIGGGDGFVCQVDPEDPDQIYSESQGGATGRLNLRTGERGSMRPRAPRGTRYRFNWKTPFLLSPHNSKIYYNAGNYVFRSPYKGNQLKAISPEITLTDKGSGSALAESPAEEGVLYAGTTDGALWVTKNGGQNWSNLYGKPDKEPAKEGQGEAEDTPQDDAGADTNEPESRPEGRQGRGQSRGQSRGQGRGMGRMLEMLKQQDANGDGMLQKDEAPERMLRMFDRLDANEDGVVDADEMKAFGRRGRGGPPPAQDPPPADEQPGEAESAEEANQEESKQEEAATEEEATEEAGQEEAAEEEADKEQEGGEPESKEEAKEEAAEEKAAESAEKPAEEKPAEEAKEEDAKEEKVVQEDTVSGTWEGNLEREGMPAEQSAVKLVVRMDKDGKLSGSFTSRMSDAVGTGKYDPEKKQVAMSFETERSTVDVFGTITGTDMAGTMEINSGAFSISFSAKRTGDAPAATESKKAEVKPGKPLSTFLPGPRWVSSIEASRFKAGRVYITCDGHRSNDDKPYVFVSEDYGTSWRSLLANLPDTIGSTRVIREDIKNQNVLYLGTEFSIWVTVDRGASWTKLNSNLPTVSIHEVAIHPTAGEIVAATHGRSLWILDVAALRQVSSETIAAEAHLYTPQPAVKWTNSPSRGSSGTRRFVGQNPPSGATICYSLGKDAGAVELKISDINGKVIREFDGETKSGLHQVRWDLRRSSPRQAQGRGTGRRGRRGGSVESGKYLITLTVDDKEMKQVLDVQDDPDAAERN